MMLAMRRIWIAVVALLAVGTLLTGCSTAAAPTPSESTAGPVSLVAVDEFSQVAQTGGTEVIDVRTPAEYDAGHLAGATNIDVEGPGFAQEIAGLDKSATYAVYCRSGNRSRTATQLMVDAGFTDVVELDGGINAWVAAGQPVS
jgi:phage shock protein E